MMCACIIVGMKAINLWWYPDEDPEDRWSDWVKILADASSAALISLTMHEYTLKLKYILYAHTNT